VIDKSTSVWKGQAPYEGNLPFDPITIEVGVKANWTTGGRPAGVRENKPSFFESFPSRR